MSNKIQFAQDFFEHHTDGDCLGGFNARVFGESWSKTVGGMHAGPSWAARNYGWWAAEKMIKSGKIYSKTEVDGKEITFKCFADGDQYCCVGEGFQDLQSSSNFAFGESFDDAILNFALVVRP